MQTGCYREATGTAWFVKCFVCFWHLKMFRKRPLCISSCQGLCFLICFDHAVYCLCSHTTFPNMRMHEICTWQFLALVCACVFLKVEILMYFSGKIPFPSDA